MQFTAQASREDLASLDGTVGLMRLEKPHNEKPVGVYSLHRLQQALEMADALGLYEVTLWRTHVDYDTGCLVVTENEDDMVGIAIAPRVPIPEGDE